MRAWRERPWAELATAGTIVAGALAVIVLDWPGHLSYDSVIQLLEGRTGVYGTWHPPVMSWLLGLDDAVLPGTGLFVFLDMAVVFGAFLSLLRLGSKITWAAAALAVLCMLSPQFLIYQGIVWKDVLFADAAVAGFVCLAHAAHDWSAIRARIALIVLAFAFFVLAALARQNGVVVAIAGAAALGWIAAVGSRGSRWRRAVAYGGGALLGATILGVCANAALNARSDAEPDEWGPLVQMKLLQDYDIVGMVAAHPGLELTKLDDTEPDLARAIRTDGVRLYTPQRNDTLASSVPLQKALANSDASEIREQWIDSIVHHPWLYLATRARAFEWVAFTPQIGRCVPFIVGVGGPADEMKHLGLKPRLDARDVALQNYANAFVGTPIFSHVTFGLVGLLALVPLLRRRRPEDIAMAFMLIGAFAFTLSFFVISIACDYRYLYALDLSAMFAAFYVTLNPDLLSAYWRRSKRNIV
jgi:hypothetical protein